LPQEFVLHRQGVLVQIRRLAYDSTRVPVLGEHLHERPERRLVVGPKDEVVAFASVVIVYLREVAVEPLDVVPELPLQQPEYLAVSLPAGEAEVATGGEVGKIQGRLAHLELLREPDFPLQPAERAFLPDGLRAEPYLHPVRMERFFYLLEISL